MERASEERGEWRGASGSGSGRGRRRAPYASGWVVVARRASPPHHQPPPAERNSMVDLSSPALPCHALHVAPSGARARACVRRAQNTAQSTAIAGGALLHHTTADVRSVCGVFQHPGTCENCPLLVGWLVGWSSSDFMVQNTPHMASSRCVMSALRTSFDITRPKNHGASNIQNDAALGRGFMGRAH